MAIQVVSPGPAGLPINAPLGQGNESGVNAYGGVAIVKAMGLSSDLTTTAQKLFTCFNGDVYIDNIIVKTDPTGIVGPTAFEITQSGTGGSAIILGLPVSGLGTNATFDMYYKATANVVTQRTVVTAGNTIGVLGTVAVGTGAGVWAVYIIYRPLLANATLA